MELTIDHVSKRFKGKNAVDDISLTRSEERRVGKECGS